MQTKLSYQDKISIERKFRLYEKGAKLLLNNFPQTTRDNQIRKKIYKTDPNSSSLYFKSNGTLTSRLALNTNTSSNRLELKKNLMKTNSLISQEVKKLNTSVRNAKPLQSFTLKSSTFSLMKDSKKRNEQVSLSSRYVSPDKKSKMLNLSLNQSQIFKSSKPTLNQSVIASTNFKSRANNSWGFTTIKAKANQVSSLQKQKQISIVQKQKPTIQATKSLISNFDLQRKERQKGQLQQRPFAVSLTPQSKNMKIPSFQEVINEEYEEKWPITPVQALKYYRHDLSEFEIIEILKYDQIYFIGSKAHKIKGSSSNSGNNFGYDDDKGDYLNVEKDQIAFRFEILKVLGKGSFGKVLKCFDHKHKQMVALKIIKNKKRFHNQAAIEVKILRFIKEKDPNNDNFCIQIKEHFEFRNHLCILFDLYSINLYEFMKFNKFQGISLALLRRFAVQILQALKFLNKYKIVHCDLKPENILLKQLNKSGLQIIDFGSSCFEKERIYTYIQSRFYRSPEVILGLPYSTPIDM